MRLMPSSLRCFYRANAHVLWLMLLVGVISFGWFLIDGNVGINLADEGYLWYGIAALKAGMIPIRDFQSYDPGRYVWITAGSILFGDGLVGMRASCVLFTCIGVTCGALAARRLSHDWGFLFLIVLPLILWMAPRYKSFEQSIALIGVYAAIRLIEQPITRQFFFSGIFIGLMAFMGRNHGVYMVVAFSLVLLFLSAGNWKVLPRRILVSCAGILVGYLPQLLMWAFVPGYLNAYIAMLGRELTLGTNLAKVVPWPWLALSQAHDIAGFCNVIQCCFYVLLPMFLFIGLCVILFLRPMQAIRHPLLVAAMAVSLPYAHFTFSR
ncbi:MAG: hypothetical protein V4710_08230, partial [Verrucomicrobiota bacterium]